MIRHQCVLKALIVVSARNKQIVGDEQLIQLITIAQLLSCLYNDDAMKSIKFPQNSLTRLVIEIGLLINIQPFVDSVNKRSTTLPYET